MHIVFICNEVPPAPSGGIGYFVLTIAEKLARLGNQVTIVGAYDKNYHWSIPGVRFVYIENGCLPKNSRSFLSKIRRDRFASPLVDRQANAIRKELLKLNSVSPIDIVEWPDYEGLHTEKIPGVKDIVRIHGPILVTKYFGLNGYDAHLESREIATLKEVRSWIGVSDWFTEYVTEKTGVAPEQYKTIYNAVNLELFRPDSSFRREPNILYAGSLIRRKGVLTLCEAANTFLRSLPESKLIIAGKDCQAELGNIESIIDPSIRHRVQIAYSLPQFALARAMQSSMVFAMPSILESFGNVWAEAMACGAAVVGSKSSCGPEIIEDGVSGVLVDPTSPLELAEVIVELIRNDNFRMGLADSGVRRAKNLFSLDRSANETLKFYAECIEMEKTEC